MEASTATVPPLPPVLRAPANTIGSKVWAENDRALSVSEKIYARVTGAWKNSTFRTYVATLVGVMSWKVALALALMLCLSVIQGAQLLLLVPLMQLVGLDVQQGSVGKLAQVVANTFELVGVPLTLASVLGTFVLLTTVLSLLTRWQTIYNFKLEQDFVATLRQRLYRAIANTNWLTFSRS